MRICAWCDNEPDSSLVYLLYRHWLIHVLFGLRFGKPMHLVFLYGPNSCSFSDAWSFQISLRTTSHTKPITRRASCNLTFFVLGFSLLMHPWRWRSKYLNLAWVGPAQTWYSANLWISAHNLTHFFTNLCSQSLYLSLASIAIKDQAPPPWYNLNSTKSSRHSESSPVSRRWKIAHGH